MRLARIPLFRWLFLAALLIAIPVLAAVLRSNPKNLPRATFALGFLPFFLTLHLYVAPYAWQEWRGLAQGFEISVLDGIAVAIILATKRVRTPLSLKIGICVYLFALVISTIDASLFVASLFYIWQVLRVILIFVAMCRATAADRKSAVGMVYGIGVGVMIQAAFSVSQSFSGLIQASGTMSHQNFLGIMTEFAVIPAFAMLLAKKNNFALLIVLAGGLVVLTGASRATAALYAAGLFLTMILSIMQRSSGRKITIAVSAAIVLAVSAPAMFIMIERRPEAARESSNVQRAAMITAARLMFADHPLGVGSNQYVMVSNVGGYADRANLAWSEEVRHAPVHNIYYLTLAEAGFMGLTGILFVLAASFSIGIGAIRRLRLDDRSEFAVGAVATIVVAAVHGAFEFIVLSYPVEVLFAMSLGVLTGSIAARRPAGNSRALMPVVASPAQVSAQI